MTERSVQESQGAAFYSDGREQHMTFYLEVLTNLRYIVDKLWASARFFATLVSALVSVSVASSIVLAKGEKWLVSEAWVAGMVSLVPVLLISIAVVGLLNLKREYRRFLENIVVATKLQDALGLYEPFPTSRFPNKTEALLPSRYSGTACESSESFVSLELKKRGNLLWYFKMLHFLYIGIGALLLGGILLIVSSGGR